MKTLNNNKMKNVITGLVLMLNASIFAQDLIITKNNQKITAKVIEVGTTEVKFKYFDAQDGPTISMKKSDIKTMKIKGKNGDNTFDLGNNDPMSTSHNMIMDKTSSFKFNFFSPLSNHLAFSYEWMQKPGFNWEVGLGIIGPGVNTLGEENSKPRGAFVKGGAKFLIGSTSDFEVEGLRYAHPLKGRYIKPEITLNAFSTSYQIDTTSWFMMSSNNPTNSEKLNVKNSYQSISFNLLYGRQYIVGNSITMGYYVGLGYSIENMSSNLASNDNYYGWDSNRYSHTYGGKEFPITFTSGFNVGYIFKTPTLSASAKHRNVSASRKSMRY